MIFTVVINQVRTMVFSPSITQIYQYTNDDVLDLISCGSNMFQVMLNGTVQMTNVKEGLLDKQSYMFVDIGISSVSRVFCPDFKQFHYLTQSGKLMVEDGIEAGKLKFKELLPGQHVIDYNSTNSVSLILTTQGLFAKGTCKDLICGISDTTFADYTIILSTLFTSPIVSFRIHEGDSKNLFIYLENGDVYLTGKSEKFPITQDLDPIRKIGSGLKSAYLGKNLSVSQSVIYYIKGADLMMYSSKLTPTEQLVQTGVRDIMYRDFQLFLSQENVEIFFENLEQSYGTELFCKQTPTNPLCIKIQDGTFNQAQDCPDNTDPVCLIKTCLADPTNSDCIMDPCSQNEFQCWALFCTKDYQTIKNKPQCFTRYINITLTVSDSKNSFFRGDLMFNNKQKPSNINNNKVSPGGAAGIAIAACVVFFVLIIIVIVVQMKKKQINTQVITHDSPAEVTIPELTTAQTIEVQ
ncbi:Hypothetical_protein [Hexamita inflata]|uniref:Hypothetical_protein n=1 Tax=Hexamita inflata TaxID=28002 RepID=A0AA86PBN6_9EUKA|nr:Hypothetical protein HINF_LOCUS21385 [Hexamita inflata]